MIIYIYSYIVCACIHISSTLSYEYLPFFFLARFGNPDDGDARPPGSGAKEAEEEEEKEGASSSPVKYVTVVPIVHSQGNSIPTSNSSNSNKDDRADCASVTSTDTTTTIQERRISRSRVATGTNFIIYKEWGNCIISCLFNRDRVAKPLRKRHFLVLLFEKDLPKVEQRSRSVFLCGRFGNLPVQKQF